MTVKINLVQKSFILSFLLILIIISSRFIILPYNNIVLLSAAVLLLFLSIIQMLEIIRMKKILIKTSNILSKGNERDFTVLQEKEKNIIDYKITNLIEQLEDSVKQSEEIHKEKDKLNEQLKYYKKAIGKIQTDINSNVIQCKRKLVNTVGTIDSLLSDFSILQSTCDSENEFLNNILEVYSTFEHDFGKINQSIGESKTISDKEISRSSQLMNSISNLSDSTDANDESIKVIFKGIENISDVTTIINDVAEKASILSLNASIESAHAGEAGKGFAVVAEEIGVLAETTAEHAGNINEALYYVTDLMSETKRIESDDLNSYPELLDDMKAINQAFIEIKELLNGISLIQKPAPVSIKEMKIKDRSILEKSIRDLQIMKSEMDESIGEIGELALINTVPDYQISGGASMHIHETSVKPVSPQTDVEI